MKYPFSLTPWLCIVTILASTPLTKAALELNFADSGLTSITFQGHNYLAEGKPTLSLVEQINTEGKSHRASNKPSQTTYDKAAQTLTQTYDWGTFSIHYGLSGDQLHLTVTLNNTSNETIQVVQGNLLQLTFPNLPDNHAWRQRRVSDDNIDGPTILAVPHDEALLVLCNEDFIAPLRSGFDAINRETGQATVFFRLGGEDASKVTLPDGNIAYVHARGEARGRSRDGRNHLDRLTLHRPIAPGKQGTFTLSLRFADRSSTTAAVAADIYAGWREQHPMTLVWPDRRPITTAFVSSSAKQHQSATNPRGWLNDPRIDITTEEGLAQFRKQLMHYADRCIAGAERLNAQAIIVWDIEGQEMPHPISYIGDPRMLAEMAPEMDALADEFFARMRDAGYGVGVTLRPTIVSEDPDKPGSYRHRYGLDESGTTFVDRLADKIAYAHDRWGVTYIYIDTNIIYRPDREGKWTSQLISPRDWAELNRRFPDILLIPEFGSTTDRGHTGPYAELRPHYWGNVASTNIHDRTLYPEAFTVINISDGPIDNRWDDLVRGVSQGDILMTRSWWSGQNEHEKVIKIYEEAATLKADE